MKSIYVKIHSYNQQQGSCLVSFASDSTKSQNPDDYEKLNYQIFNMWPDVTDITQIPKLLAVTGKYETERQAVKEALIIDESKNSMLNSFVGQTFTFTDEELSPPPQNVNTEPNTI